MIVLAVVIQIVVIIGLTLGFYYFYNKKTTNDSDSTTTPTGSSETLDPDYFYVYYLKTNMDVDSIAINEYYFYPNDLTLNVASKDDVNLFVYYTVSVSHNKALEHEHNNNYYNGKRYVAFTGSAGFQTDSLVTFTWNMRVPTGIYFFTTIGIDCIAINAEPIDITETDNYTRFAFKQEWKV